jgi:hypothetical protein
MIKTIQLITVIFISTFFFENSSERKNIEIYKTVKINNSENFTGKWNYEFNSDENELLNKTFELNLIQNKDVLRGQYCAIAKGGRKIDCNDSKVFNILGKIKDNIAYVDFTGFYDNKARGKAKIYFDNDNLIWEIQSVNGEIYAPKKVVLKNESIVKNSYEGSYLLESCDQSRFKIKIEKKDLEILYYVFDKSKIILKGKATKNKNIISLGKMSGEFSENKLIIQNYGNSMNDYNHFNQCSEKYLSFIKQ